MSAAQQELHQSATSSGLHLTLAHLLAQHLPLMTRWPSAWLDASLSPHETLSDMVSSLTPRAPHERALLIVSPELVPSLSLAEARACLRLCLTHAAQRLWRSPSDPLALQRLSERLCEAYDQELGAWERPVELERWLNETLAELWRPEPAPAPLPPQEALQGALEGLEFDEELDEELDEGASFGATLDDTPLFDAAPEELEEPEPTPKRELEPPPELEKVRKRAAAPAPPAPSARSSALPPPPPASAPAPLPPAPAPQAAQPAASAPPMMEAPAEVERSELRDEPEASMLGGAPPLDLDEELREEELKEDELKEERLKEEEPLSDEPERSGAERALEPPSRVEGWLDDDSADPGPLERLIERVRVLSAALNATLGLHALPLLHLIDQLWELLSGYIKGVFGGLMSLRSAMRVSERRARGELSKGFADDAQRALTLTSALLCLPQPSKSASLPLESPRGEHLLALALTTRAQLDDLKRDLAQLRGGGVKRGFFSALKNYVLDLIPNPLSVFKPWWTWLLVTFGVRFKRATVIELVSVLRDELTALVDDLSREEGGERVDHGARVSELRAQLSRLQLITLQSHHHARPAQWGTLSLITELKRAEGQQLSHPLTVTQARLCLLERLVSASVGVSQEEQRVLISALSETKRLHDLLTTLHERAQL